VVEVMNFLAAHPTESFTLTEIATRLGLSVGSAHRVLTTLAEARYLSRHPRHKTYSLGMALVAIGEAALAQHRDLELARREMVELARELKLQCHASAVVNDELLLLATEGAMHSREPLDRPGTRRPYMPPLGMVHAAWAEPDEQEDYISRAPAALSDRTRAHLARSLNVVRARGYAMSSSGPAFRALRQFTAGPVSYHGDEAYWAGLRQLIADLSEREMQLDDFEEAGSAGISFLTVPVFSPAGRVSLELTLSDLPQGLTRIEFERHLERLWQAANAVTQQSHGRPPAALSRRETSARQVADGVPNEGAARQGT
jgi:DNA-binding IclR family transcriptional regulator